MKKPVMLKGQIKFFSKRAGKEYEMKYSDPVFKEGFEESLTDTMMTSFHHLKLTAMEKKQLSRSHRKILNYYRHLNPFSLNQDAKKLVLEINQYQDAHVVIEADQYGAFICLAALYSGKISEEKRIEFILKDSPLALFPKVLAKKEPKENLHKIIFRLSESSWLEPFNSLYGGHTIKYSLDSIRKAA